MPRQRPGHENGQVACVRVRSCSSTYSINARWSGAGSVPGSSGIPRRPGRTYLPSRDVRPPGKVLSRSMTAVAFSTAATVPGRLDVARGSDSSPVAAPDVIRTGCQLPPDPVWTSASWRKHLDAATSGPSARSARHSRCPVN